MCVCRGFLSWCGEKYGGCCNLSSCLISIIFSFFRRTIFFAFLMGSKFFKRNFFHETLLIVCF